MRSLLSKTRKWFMRVRGRWPSALPVGSDSFDRFVESIFETYNLPDLPSYRHCIATMIMHLDPTAPTKPKKYFALSIQKAMANQVAYSKIQEIKDQEKQEEERAKEEVTPAEELTIASEG